MGEQHIKWEEDNAPQSHALLQSLSSSPIPSLPVPPASSVFERLGEKVQVKKTKTQLKAETTKDFKHSKRCKICDHTVHAPTPTSLANVWAQHHTSKMHKAAVQAKKDAKNTPQQAPHPLASLPPVERAYAQMVDVPPPPTSMAKGENQGDVRIMKAQITQATSTATTRRVRTRARVPVQKRRCVASVKKALGARRRGRSRESFIDRDTRRGDEQRREIR